MKRDPCELVDARTGLICSVTRLAKSCEEPELPVIFQARLANFDFRKVDVTERMSSGKGATAEVAMRGAIAEALERYCACQPDAARVRLTTTAQLPWISAAPEEFVLFSPRQYADSVPNRRRITRAEPLTWIEGRRIADDAPIFLPASLVYLNFTGNDGAERFAPSTSNGLAAGPDLTSAVLAGLYELIERDAFMIGWLNRLPSNRIAYQSAGGVTNEISRHYRRYKIEILAFDITTDVGVPAVMALAVDRSGAMPAVVVGLGCNLNPRVALERAVMEVAQVRGGAAARYRQESRRYPTRYEDVHTLEDHAAFAALPTNLTEFAFLFDNARTIELDDIPNHAGPTPRAQLESCQARVAGVGAVACYVDLTLPDLEPYPMRVVRCLATELQPIHFGYAEERLGGRRLFEVPRRLGYRERDVTEDELNPCPHPLA